MYALKTYQLDGTPLPGSIEYLNTTIIALLPDIIQVRYGMRHDAADRVQNFPLYQAKTHGGPLEESLQTFYSNGCYLVMALASKLSAENLHKYGYDNSVWMMNFYKNAILQLHEFLLSGANLSDRPDMINLVIGDYDDGTPITIFWLDQWPRVSLHGGVDSMCYFVLWKVWMSIVTLGLPRHYVKRYFYFIGLTTTFN